MMKNKFSFFLPKWYPIIPKFDISKPNIIQAWIAPINQHTPYCCNLSRISDCNVTLNDSTETNSGFIKPGSICTRAIVLFASFQWRYHGCWLMSFPSKYWSTMWIQCYLSSCNFVFRELNRSHYQVKRFIFALKSRMFEITFIKWTADFIQLINVTM